MQENDKNTTPATAKEKDEIALELMKFIANTTGCAKGPAAVGFSGKNAARTPDEQADALFALFERCRKVVHTNPEG